MAGSRMEQIFSNNNSHLVDDEEEKDHGRSNPCTTFFKHGYQTTKNYMYEGLKKTNFFGAAITMSQNDGTGLSEVIDDVHKKALLDPRGFHEFQIFHYPAVYIRKQEHIHEIYIKKQIKDAKNKKEFEKKQDGTTPAIKGASSYDKSGIYAKLFNKDNILVLAHSDPKYRPQRDVFNILLDNDLLSQNAPLMLKIINKHLDSIVNNRIDDLEHFLNYLIIDLVMEIQLGVFDLSAAEKQYFIDLGNQATPHIANLATLIYDKLGIPTALDAIITGGRKKMAMVMNRNEATIAITNNLIKAWREAKINFVDPVDVFGIVLFASYKSTTEAMLFTLMLLADPHHKDFSQGLAGEIRKTFDEEKISKEGIDKIKSLDWAVMKSLELYPPFPIFKDELSEDITLEGKTFKKGTLVFLSPLRYHSENIRGPSAAKFLPAPGLFDVDLSCKFITFGSFPRTCPGRMDSKQKLKLLVTCVLLRGDISLTNENLHHPFPVREIFSLQLDPKVGKVGLVIAPRVELDNQNINRITFK